MRESPQVARRRPACPPGCALAPCWTAALARLHRFRDPVCQAAESDTLAEQALRALKVEVLTEHRAARLVRRTGVQVVPMFISGSNSALFQIAGLGHPRLRSVLVPSEPANKAAMRIDLCVGSAISPERCRRIGSDTHLAAFLRLSAYLLQLRHAPSRTHTALREAIAPPIETGVLRRYLSARAWEACSRPHRRRAAGTPADQAA